MEKLLTIAGMALVTYLTRYAMIAVLGHQVPPLVQRWLRHVPVALLAALIAPAVLAPQGSLEIGMPLWITLLGTIVAWRTRSVFWTVAAGMAAFWVVRIAGL